MVQGTASNVGKSVVAAGLCRVLHQDGWRVAPFKSQNMALNSAVTVDGGEIGRAQFVQAQAARVEPSVDMNPILLKPKRDMESQVMVLGKPAGDMSALAYRTDFLPRARPIVAESLRRLATRFDAIVIEGAGSPVEMNLKEREIVNMAVAEIADAPVILVADIDRGGVFASVIGTLDLLEPHERARVCGVIVNKFRGDPRLFENGVRFLEERTGKPVLGVLPWLDLAIEDEDSLALEGRRESGAAAEIDVVVVRTPRISNFSDLQALEHTPGVAVRFERDPARAARPDVLILAGSKNTVEDLAFLRAEGWEEAIVSLARHGTAIAGLCGGFQMLGRKLRDPEGVESVPGVTPGLGLLDVETVFTAEKRTVQTTAEVVADSGCFEGCQGLRVRGYEIHMGRSTVGPDTAPLLSIDGRQEGVISRSGQVFGTYLHGLFDNDELRRRWVNGLRARKGLRPLQPFEGGRWAERREAAFDELAAAIRRHVRLDLVYHAMGLPARAPAPPAPPAP